MLRFVPILPAALCLGLTAGAACAGALDSFGTDVEWKITVLAGEKVPQGQRVTLTQTAPGQISGSTGCNRYAGQVTEGQNGAQGALSFGPVAVTRMMCPPAQMHTEAALFAALTGARWVRPDGAALVLSDAEGKDLLRAER